MHHAVSRTLAAKIVAPRYPSPRKWRQLSSTASAAMHTSWPTTPYVDCLQINALGSDWQRLIGTVGKYWVVDHVCACNIEDENIIDSIAKRL